MHTYYINSELKDIKNISKINEEKLSELNKSNNVIKEKLNKVINKIVWFIPIKKYRDNVRTKMKNYFNI